MKKVIAIAAALLLVAAPVIAQGSPEMPPAGTVVVVAGISDGVTFIPLDGAIVVPPLACDPN